MSDVTQPLIPGQFVTHPEHGHGLVGRTEYGIRVNGIHGDGDRCIFSLHGWEPVETLRPGHVQVRVDDLGQDGWSRWESSDEDREPPLLRALSRIAKAIAAQIESHTDAPTTESVADSDTPKYTPGQRYRDCEGDVWVVTGHGKLALEQPDKPLGFGFSAWRVEEENGPLTLIDDEQPTTTTVSLPCPDCGQGITREVALLRAEGSTPPAWSITPRPAIAHRCQPDEPTDPGSKVTVNDQRFVLADDDAGDRWINIDNGDSWGWAHLCFQGTVTLGWGDDQ